MSELRTRWLLTALLVLVLAGCSKNDSPINSPYISGAERQNTLYTAFFGSSPKYLDPASSYSANETNYTYNIYEPLYGYHYLKRPYGLIPRGAAEVVHPYYLDNNGQRLPDDAPAERIAESVYDIPIRKGTRFQPHPAFARRADGSYVYFPLEDGELEGKFKLPDFPETGTRELTADDYAYALRRLASPRLVSPSYSVFSAYIVGMSEYGDALRAQDKALRAELPPGSELPWLDYRQGSLPGVKALDNHTLRIRIKGKNPQFNYWLAMSFTAPIPWEADRFYSQPGMAAHNLSLNTWPVGTGPFMLVESIQNRRHVLERNPNYRIDTYPCEGEADDQAAGLLADCGKQMPFIDRAVFTLEKERIPLMGKFMQGYYDAPAIDRTEYGVSLLTQAGDSAEAAARFADHKLKLPTSFETANWYVGFNWFDPVIGQGATPQEQERHRKLRQALSIAFDWESYIAVFLAGKGSAAHSPVPPGVLGHEPPPQGYNPVVYNLQDGQVVRKPIDEAKRLLAEAGYPNGRDAKTGQPLILQYDTMSDDRSMFDWMRQQTQKLGIQLEFRGTDYNRFQDRMRKGAAQIFFWGWVADYPDAENFLFLLYGPNGKVKNNGENAANYSSPEYDRLFEQMKSLNDGPEKVAVIQKMVAVVQQDAPWTFGWNPMAGGAYQQWVSNAKPTQMVRDSLRYIRLDPALRAEKIKEWNQPVLWPLGVLLIGLAILIWPAWQVLKRRERETAFGVPVAAHKEVL
jgi:ABC-type transport system substrate-binding protein